VLAGNPCGHQPEGQGPRPDDFSRLSVVCVLDRDTVWSYCQLPKGSPISPVAVGYDHGLHLLTKANCFTVKDGCIDK